MAKQQFSMQERFGSPEERMHAKVYARIQELKETKIEPPADIKEKMCDLELEMFDEIIEECPIIEWTKHRIRIAAMFARCLHRHEIHFDEMVECNGITEIEANGATYQKLSPHVSIMKHLAIRLHQYRRELNLHDTIIGGTGGITSRREKIQRIMDESVDAFEGARDVTPKEENKNDIRQLIAVPKND